MNSECFNKGAINDDELFKLNEKKQSLKLIYDIFFKLMNLLAPQNPIIQIN